MRSILLAITLCAAAQAAPVLFYSDLPSGPNSGGRLNYGAAVCVSGARFGATRGTSTITVGGGLVADYLTWADGKACFQLGSAAVTGNIVLTVGGAASNGLPFTVRAASIYFAGSTADIGGSPGTPSDSNPGTFDAPKLTARACKNLLTSGSGAICYLRGTVAQTTGTESGKASMVLSNSGTLSAPLAIVGWPGDAKPIIGDWLPPSAEAGMKNYPGSDHWVVAGLALRGPLKAFEIGYTSPTDFRIVNNLMECPAGWSGTGCLIVAISSNPSQHQSWKIFGNEVTNAGCGENTTSGPDNSGGLALQVRQYPCTPSAMQAGTLSMSGGSTLTITGASFPYNTVLYRGVHILVDTDGDGTYEEAVLDSATASTVTLYSNSFVATTFSGKAWMYKNFTADKLYHPIYMGGDTNGMEFGWNWIHNNVAQHGINLHSTASSGTQSQAISGVAVGTPARVTLSSPFTVYANGAVALVNGQRIDVVGNSAIPDGGYFVSLPTPGNYGVIDLYADETLTIPVSAAASGTGGNVGRSGFAMFGISIHDNLIHDQNGACISLANGDPDRGAITIYNNVMHDCGTGPDSALTGLSMPGVYMLNPPDSPTRNAYGAGTVEFYNNTVHNVSKYYPSALPGKTYGVVFMYSTPKPLFFRMRNNILSQPGGLPFHEAGGAGANITGFDNTWFGTATLYPPNLTDRFTFDPKFVNISTGNFQLQSTSPAIDTGVTISGRLYDPIGTPVPQGIAPEVGAYEYIAGATPTDPLTITTTSLPGGVVSGAYTQTLAASGGAGAKAWDTPVNDCAGISMSSGGVFSGTPLVAATCAVTARVADDSGSTTRDYTVTIAAAPSDPSTITVTSTGARASILIRYGAAGLAGNQACTIDLKQGSTVIQTQADSGGRAYRVAAFTGLAAGAYVPQVTCTPFGAGTGGSVSVAASSGLTAAVPVKGSARTEIAATKMKVEWGYTAALAGTPVTTSCLGPCEVTIPGVATGAVVWFRQSFLDSTDAVVAAGSAFTVIVQ